MAQYRITLTLTWNAESKEEATQDLLEEVNDPGSMLFGTVSFNVEEA